MAAMKATAIGVRVRVMVRVRVRFRVRFRVRVGLDLDLGGHEGNSDAHAGCGGRRVRALLLRVAVQLLMLARPTHRVAA